MPAIAAALLALCLAGAACGSPPVAEAPTRVDPWDEARQRGVEFRAVGQEPGWYLEIDYGTSMHLVYDYMERQATTPAPPPTFEPGRTIYSASADSQSLEVIIEPRRCYDGMSGEAFTTTVTVYINRRELRGCGRAVR